MLAFRPTNALTPYGKGAKLASQSSELVGVTARFEMAQALFQNQIPAWYFAALEGDTGKIQHKTTITTTTHTCAHIHTSPPRSACKCVHSTHLNNTKKQNKTNHSSFLLGVYFELEEIPDHWHAKANLYVFYSGIFADQGLLWDSEIQWSLRAQANHWLQCSTASEPPGGTIWVYVPSCQTGGPDRQ